MKSGYGIRSNDVKMEKKVDAPAERCVTRMEKNIVEDESALHVEPQLSIQIKEVIRRTWKTRRSLTRESGA
ncbi:hypothetical protein E2C01_051881 [Portunus trituberculatus]|uniref:Uncharacterized protein n=1 Tax=Portunus trituberculatus TaxID=210409 RepID=A0A5B7GCZ5_PORTR|nr:hypothetical protein [Portunus trituberculatus]